MEYSSRSSNAEAIKMEARDLAQNLLSRDPILFNSALNAYFDANASYHGHALRIKGISQIKHAAWLWNMLNLGRSTDLVSKDVHWNHKNLTLSLTATRHLRPVTLPIFTFAVPVKTIITFEPTRDDDNVDHLYAVHWEDQWPLGHALEHLPIVGFFVTALLSPIASYFFLAISNFLFAIDARTRTFARHWTGPQAQQQYSQTVPASVRQGFEQGERVAQGWGQYLLSGGTRAAYHPLKALEWTAQTAVAIASQVSPVRLPAVSVFDPQTGGEVRSIIHGAPLNEPVPVRTQKSLAATESHAKRTAQEDVTNPRGEAQHAETAPYELPATMVDGNKGGIKKATVEVGPSADAKAKSFDVSKHQHNDAKQNPSHGREAPRPSADGKDAKKASLFEQVDKSTLESAEKAAEKAARKAKKAAERRSEEDGHKSKQTKTKHSSDDSGSDGRVESAKSSGKSSQTNTPTKKRKDHGGRH